ncbi:MAG TPA: hypothetical protein VFS76_18815 [Pyrinomonadaceae bacterium]|nr:hypothetical protein [Pyrinomonadaceae bacterium]
MSILNSKKQWFGNKLTLDELAQIEANAERSKTPEAETILRLAAALREAMQVSEGAFACMGARNLDQRTTSHLSALTLTQACR